MIVTTRTAMTWLRRRVGLMPVIAVSLIAVASFSDAKAQGGYPSKPVRVIVPFGPGGVADVTTRLVSEKLSEKLGQRFIVENAPGAGGIAAARSAISGGNDGYTIILLTNGTAISVPLFKSLPYDPVKDFVPISTIGYFDTLFIVNGESPYKTLQDFIKAAKDNPGKLNVGTINPGSTQHLTSELFKSSAGINFVNVTFRTTGEAVVALLRNDVQMVIDFYAALKPGLSDGKTRALATGGLTRSPALPNVPTVAQSGVPGFEVVAWNALYAPTGTPSAVIQTLNAALRTVLNDPELKKRALDLGIDAKASSPAEAEARLTSDIKKWGVVIEKAGIPKQ
ncbi:MAG TPA: tripartite tricarboxylate transporter substrate-binding protein [Xanthobacteraceae bacterium]|nr:tripartite tricarboxylate transporter substrate-binding protein [Xanthobacteraceae bacterium]